MKKIILSLILYSYSTLYAQGTGAGAAADPIRQKLINLLEFVYVDKPHRPQSDPTASEVLNNQNIANNTGLTGRPFWDNPNNTTMQNLVKKVLQPAAANSADRKLQYVLSKVIEIQNRPVQIYLFNDKDNQALITGGFHTSWGYQFDPNDAAYVSPAQQNYIWPHAQHNPTSTHIGFMRLGSKYLADAGGTPTARNAVIVHELVHTQDNSEFSTTFGANYYYGRDGSHSLDEIICNYNAAYVEGLANAFEYMYSSDRSIYTWLNANRDVYYEVVPTSACPGLPANSCLDTYLGALATPVTPISTATQTLANGTTYQEKHYNVRSLPSDVLIHSEYFQAYVMYAYMKYFSMSALVNDVQRCTTQTNGKYGFPFVFEQMVKTANQFGGATTSTTHGQHLPLAMLDFFTGFKLSDKAMLDRCLRNPTTSGWTVNIDSYWTSHRPRMLQILRDHNNQFTIAALRQMAVHFNVVSPN